MAPSPETGLLRLALAGVMIEPLRLLLVDVLGDGGVRHAFTTRAGACDVVIVMVTWGDELAAIADARALAGDVPVLAILPFGDDDLARRVLAAGARGWFALGTPLALLRASLVKLADLAACRTSTDVQIATQVWQYASAAGSPSVWGRFLPGHRSRRSTRMSS